jgi:hypothetical protein
MASTYLMSTAQLLLLAHPMASTYLIAHLHFQSEHSTAPAPGPSNGLNVPHGTSALPVRAQHSSWRTSKHKFLLLAHSMASTCLMPHMHFPVRSGASTGHHVPPVPRELILTNLKCTVLSDPVVPIGHACSLFRGPNELYSDAYDCLFYVLRDMRQPATTFLACAHKTQGIYASFVNLQNMLPPRIAAPRCTTKFSGTPNSSSLTTAAH